jgi:hypothetical protein
MRYAGCEVDTRRKFIKRAETSDTTSTLVAVTAYEVAFYETAAQVILVLLIVIGIEARMSADPRMAEYQWSEAPTALVLGQLRGPGVTRGAPACRPR